MITFSDAALADKLQFIPQLQISNLSPAEIRFDKTNPNLMLVVNQGGRIDVFNIGDPAAPIKIAEINASALHASFIHSRSQSGKVEIISGGQNGRIRRWSLAGELILETTVGHAGSLSGLAVSRDDDRIASSGDDGTIRIWTSDMHPVGDALRVSTSSIAGLAFSPDGASIVSGGADGNVRLCKIKVTLECNLYVGNSRAVRSVDFSPDGKEIVSGSDDGSLHLWTIAGKQLPIVFRGHDDIVRSVAFSPSGEFIASGGEDKTIRLWTLSGAQIGQPFGSHTKIVTSVAFSPNGRVIASGGLDRTVRLWTLSSKMSGDSMRGHKGPVESAEFSPDGREIVSSGDDGTVRVWAQDGNPIGTPFLGHKGEVGHVAFMQDSGRVMSAGWDGTLRIWTLEGKQVGGPLRGDGGIITAASETLKGGSIITVNSSGTIQRWTTDANQIGTPITTGQSVFKAAISADGNHIATGDFTGICRLWTTDGVEVRALSQEDHGPVQSIAFSPDSRLIACGGSSGKIRVWTLDGKQVGQTLAGPAGNVTSVAFSPDGLLLATGGDDGTIRVWSINDSHLIELLNDAGGSVQSIAFSPDGRRIVSGGFDGVIRVWDFTGEPLAEPLAGHPQAVMSAAFSPDIRRIAAKSPTEPGYNLEVWPIGDAPVKRQFDGLEDKVASLAYGSDATKLVVGGTDGTLRILTADGKIAVGPVKVSNYWVTSLAISPDGARIAAGSMTGDISFWNFEGKPVGNPTHWSGGSVSSLAFAPDGTRIAAGGGNGEIRVWTLDGRQIGQPLSAAGEDVEAITFTPDGDGIVSAGYGRDMRIWNPKVGTSRVVPSQCSANSIGFQQKKFFWLICLDRLRITDLSFRPRGELFFTEEGFAAALFNRGVILPSARYAGSIRPVDNVGTPNWRLGAIPTVSFKELRQTLFDEWTPSERAIDWVNAKWRAAVQFYDETVSWYGRGPFWSTLFWIFVSSLAAFIYIFWPHKLAEWAMPKVGAAPLPKWRWLAQVLEFYRYVGSTKRPLHSWLRRQRAILAPATFYGRTPVTIRATFCVLGYQPVLDFVSESITQKGSMRIWISGDGGTGKSALAYQIVRTTMQSPGSPLPLLIDEDWNGDLLEHIAIKLRVGARHPTRGMVEHLGNAGLICPIFDQLSERNLKGAVDQVAAAIDSGALKSLIVTARKPQPREAAWESLRSFAAQPVMEADIPTYIAAYAPRADMLELTAALAPLIAGVASVSPLFLRFAVEQITTGMALQSSSSFRLVLNYVEGLRAGRSDVSADDFLRAAEIAAFEAVREALAPREVEYSAVRAVLTREADRAVGQFADEAATTLIPPVSVLEDLIYSGLLMRTVENRRLKFVYDPVAEYLAASRLRKLIRANEGAQFGQRLKEKNNAEKPFARIFAELT